MDATCIPVSETMAGKGSLIFSHPLNLGAVGHGHARGECNRGGNDLVIGIGTRYSDFTTASKTAFANPEVRFINLNVAN